MRAPTWFLVVMTLWVLFGLPGYILGSLWKGSPIPDGPPFLYSSQLLDQTVGTVIWLMVMLIVLAPLWAIPALLIWSRKLRKRFHAEN